MLFRPFRRAAFAALAGGGVLLPAAAFAQDAHYHHQAEPAATDHVDHADDADHADHADHAGHGADARPETAHVMPDRHAGHGGMMAGPDDHAVTGSGTARMPAAAPMAGLHAQAGDWMLMAHGYAWGFHTNQGGPRGDSRTAVQSMAMLEASRPLGDGVGLTLRSMASLDPLMGRRGYPLLFATGETAGGEPLVDRQHPHDLFMELSARIDVEAGDGSLFVYAGLPGEPAVGPPAFMHRASARFNPEAPIAHHWFDSTHITYGVVTAGWAGRTFQIEASAFKGREPDEQRWDIDPPKLDSVAVRATWTPTRNVAAQVSWARLESPEVTHQQGDESRLTGSLSYAADGIAATAGWSRKDRLPGRVLDAWFLESTADLDTRNAVFGRVEQVENDELFDHHMAMGEQSFRATKFAVGYAHTIPLGAIAGLSLGGSVMAYAKDDALDAAYGKAPKGFTLFAKLSLGEVGAR